jgi:1,4-alpha-glucan branching enzyme
VRFNSDWNGYDPSFADWFAYDTDAEGPGRDRMPTSGDIGCGAYSALILSQD